MNNDKWKFTEPDAQEMTAKQKERRGMIVLLILGIILFAGGMYFAIKIGAFDLDGFWGLDPEKANYRRMRAELSEYSLFFHAPWMAGSWMMSSAIRYFLKQRR